MTADLFFLNIKNKSFLSRCVLLFDLDGTLLDTNLANNESYRYAIWKVTGKNYPELSNLKRVTRKDVATLPGITSEMLEQIVQIKKNSFWYNREYTYPLITHEILKQKSVNTPCYIISSADKERVQQLARYYQLDRFVKGYIYADPEDKYCDIASKLNVNPSDIILFEDEADAITNATNNGIDEKHIVPVSAYTLKKQIIAHNEYLAQDIIGYYSLDYMRYGMPNNPDFINTLKNQFNEYNCDTLHNPLRALKGYLKRDIRCIFDMMNVQDLTVVGIPRSKAECEYSNEQQYFRRGIQEAVQELQNEFGLPLIDGSHFIMRHTNTKTTHLSKSENVENDGDMPYPGITKATCNISDKVAGKDILLIDDIYTLDVNIDEDAIQALYDMGAKSVRFYAVCKTFKIRKRR
jgi:FMN phosphatase YigB (HAD superfamily)